MTVREIVDKEGAALPEAAAGMEVWVTAPAGVAEDDRVFKVTDVRQLEEVARLCRERGVEFFAGTPRIAHAGEFSAWQEFLRELAGRGVIDGYLLAGLGWLRVYRDLPPCLRWWIIL